MQVQNVQQSPIFERNVCQIIMTFNETKHFVENLSCNLFRENADLVNLERYHCRLKTDLFEV